MNFNTGEGMMKMMNGRSFQTPIVPTLDKVLEAQPEKREAILDEMKQILTPMAQK